MPSNPPSSPAQAEELDDFFLDDEVDQVNYVNSQHTSTSRSSHCSPTDVNTQLLPTCVTTHSYVNTQPTTMNSTHVDNPPSLTNTATQPQHTNDNIQTTPMHITFQSPAANDNSNNHTAASTFPDPPCVNQENEHEDCQTGSPQQEGIDTETADGFPDIAEGGISFFSFTGIFSRFPFMLCIPLLFSQASILPP